MKGRKAQNQIKVFIAANGTIIRDPEDIKPEVVDFYKTLLGQAAPNLPVIHPAVIRNAQQELNNYNLFSHSLT